MTTQTFKTKTERQNDVKTATQRQIPTSRDKNETDRTEHGHEESATRPPEAPRGPSGGCWCESTSEGPRNGRLGELLHQHRNKRGEDREGRERGIVIEVKRRKGRREEMERGERRMGEAERLLKEGKMIRERENREKDRIEERKEWMTDERKEEEQNPRKGKGVE